MCHSFPMQHDNLDPIWEKLRNSMDEPAPRIVVKAFVSLGGDQADPIYCTSYTDGQERIWRVIAIAGNALIKIRATGPEYWDAQSELQFGHDTKASLDEASISLIPSSVAALRVLNALSYSRNVSPWVTSWEVAMTAGETVQLPVPADLKAAHRSQHEPAEAVALAIRAALMDG
jgi:hypothetical protein